MHVLKCFSPSFFKLFYIKSFLWSQWKGTIIVMEMNPLLPLQYGFLYVQLNVCVYANNNYLFVASEIIFKGHGFTERAERMQCF